MFGALKKKLKDVISKAAGKKPEEKIEEVSSQHEKIEEKIEEKITELKQIEQAVEEQNLPEEIKKSGEEEKQAFEEVLQETRQVQQPTEKPQQSGASIQSDEKKGISKIFSHVTEKTLTEGDIQGILKDMEIALLENDVSFEVAEKICIDIKAKLLGKNVKRGSVDKIIKESMRRSISEILSQKKPDISKLAEEKSKTGEPYTIMFLGFNGTGKTTTLAKLAHKLSSQRPLLAAGDTFRAASIEQLEEHSRRLGMKVIKHTYGSDSAAVIFDARKHAASAGYKIVLADTAGRSHSNINLMDELKKIVRVNNPDLKILVLDSLTGNDIYEQARLFDNAVGVDAIILTKADVYEKGGAALSASYTLGKPVLYIGTGQSYEDLVDFNAEEVTKRLLE